jgi:hypothetical protein
LTLAGLAVAAVVLLAGCGGSGENTSPADLQGVLLAPDQFQPPLEGLRDFSWENPTDFVVQGIVYPENTKPTAVIGEIDDDGFEAAAGHLAVPKGEEGPQIHLAVARFDSDDGAKQAQDYLHGQDKLQPCYAACVVNPEDYTVPGVSGATAVHQVPNGQKGAPGVEPFERYAVEFTVGSDLYVVSLTGDPGTIPAAALNQGVKELYDYAQQHAG